MICCSLERVEYRVNNTVNTFVDTTQDLEITIPVATTNVQLVCYSNNQKNDWNVTINSFSAGTEINYECVFGDGRTVSVLLKAVGRC